MLKPHDPASQQALADYKAACAAASGGRAGGVSSGGGVGRGAPALSPAGQLLGGGSGVDVLEYAVMEGPTQPVGSEGEFRSV